MRASRRFIQSLIYFQTGARLTGYPMKDLGAKIKHLRTSKGLTIVQVARSTGIDQATLSRIENGKMTGTLESHMRIADTLGVRLPQLYDNVLSHNAGIKEEAVRQKIENFSFSTGAVAEILTGGILQKKMMPSLLKLKPKGHTQTEEFKDGTERFAYILSGSIELLVGREKHALSAGESLYFDASTPHHFTNKLKSPAQILSILTPASL